MKREIARRYEHLLLSVKTKDYYTKVDLTNRVNCYTCRCGHITKVRDIDAGVTPMFFSCEKCNQTANSTGYHDIVPNQEPTQELKEVLKLKEGMLEHVLSGGLMIRKISEAPIK